MTFSPRKSFNNGELPGNTAPRGGAVCPSDESVPAARATRAPRPPGGEAWLLGILYRYLRTAPIITCGNAEATLRNRKRTETRAERCLPPWPRRTTAAGPHRPTPTPTLCPTATFIPPTQFVSRCSFLSPTELCSCDSQPQHLGPLHLPCALLRKPPRTVQPKNSPLCVAKCF